MNLFRSTKKLFAAIEAGDLETVRAYIEADKDKWLAVRDSGDNMPLHKAAAGGYTKIVKYLLENDATQYRANKGGEMPLHCAIAGNHIEVVKELLHKGDTAHINLATRGISPLQAAISYNRAEILDLFLKTGKTDLVKGKPPALYYAVQSRKPEMVRLLLAAGADPNVPKAEEEHDNYDDEDYFFSPRRRRNRSKPEKETPLHLAAKYNEAEIAKDLLAAGAKPLGHEFPLHAAAAHGNIELATGLIAYGVNVHAQNAEGQTALHAAATKGHVDMARFLLAQGVNKDAADAQGRTALSYAQQFAFTEMVALLQEPVRLAPVAIRPVEKPAPAVTLAASPAPASPPPRVEEKPEQDSETWARAGKDSVIRTSTFPAIGRKLTEIFNFESRERITITENLKLGSETMSPHESFDAISENALMRALQEFRRLGGKAGDDEVFQGRLLKSKLKPGGRNG